MFNQEDALIPFNTSPLPSGPWVVFAPHADDETFGMGGTLLKAKKQGIETHLVVLTDGARGGVADDLVEVRRREVQQVAKILGFRSLQCWSEPDRFLDIRTALIEKVRDLILDLKPKCVFLPGPFEIHPDHRAAALLVWSALTIIKPKEKRPEPFAYEIGVQNPINFLVDVTEQIGDKKKVMALYESQNKENNYPELVLSLDKGRTFSLPDRVEFAEGFYRHPISSLDSSFEEITHRIVKLYLRNSPNEY